MDCGYDLCGQIHGVVNTWRPEQNGWCVADNILKCIFLDENCILIFTEGHP